MDARLAALIVNYDSGAYALALVQSLHVQWRELGRSPDQLEIVVVDNASRSDQSRELAQLRTLGVRVVQSTQNLGYGAGMNFALEQTRGGPRDLVLVLNPDLALFPGALARLLDGHAERSGIGALGPRAFLDPIASLCMPPNRLPTPRGEWLAARALRDPELAERLGCERTRHALREWCATEPIEVEMLSGACLLLSRAAIAVAGGLFDERYPFYFEDTDLCRRLQQAGLALVLEPRATIVHHWARSSGIERGDSEPARRHVLSRAAYFERWFDASERRDLALAGELAGLPAPDLEPGFRSLGALTRPPTFEFPRAGRWLIELAMVPSFPLAAGAIVEGTHWRVDERAFEWFYRGRYFVRAVDPLSARIVGAWSFDKPSLARSEPLEPRELEKESKIPL